MARSVVNKDYRTNSIEASLRKKIRLNEFHRLYFWTFFCNKNQVNLAKPWVFGKNPWVFPKNPWVFLKILWVYSKEWKNFPKFPEFSWFQALKLKFGQTFVQNISTLGLFWAKSQFLVGKLLSFWIICLSFSKICLSFFFGLSFFGLEFFRNVQKSLIHCKRLQL